MTTPIDEAIAHLGAALMQTLSDVDDQIIMGHVRSAHELLKPLHSARAGGAAEDWQPIETAPPGDGPMNLIDVTGRQVIARRLFSVTDGTYAWVYAREWLKEVKAQVAFVFHDPTHWAPCRKPVLTMREDPMAAPLPFGSATSGNDVPT